MKSLSILFSRLTGVIVVVSTGCAEAESGMSDRDRRASRRQISKDQLPEAARPYADLEPWSTARTESLAHREQLPRREIATTAWITGQSRPRSWSTIGGNPCAGGPSGTRLNGQNVRCPYRCVFAAEGTFDSAPIAEDHRIGVACNLGVLLQPLCSTALTMRIGAWYTV
jgi:hypothetical protein